MKKFFLMTGIATILALGVINESRAEYCEWENGGSWSEGSINMSDGILYYYRCYSDSSKAIQTSSTDYWVALEKAYYNTRVADNTVYIESKTDSNISYTLDTVPMYQVSRDDYDANGNNTEYSFERKDGDGNVVSYGSAQYEYDADDNLISSNYNDYYGNGKLMGSEQGTYVYDDDGNEIHSESVDKGYYENGQIWYDYYYEWDEVTGSKDFEKEYYENGQLSSEYESYDYPDGTYNRSAKDYYENGQLSQTTVIGRDENGIYTENYVYYNENGNITSEENYTENPDGTWTRDNMYYEYDDDDKLLSRTNEICNDDGCSSVSYDANGDLLSVNGNEVTENCASADSNGVCTKCKDGFDDIDGYCNKIRWTPAEAAKVLRDDNTNEVTITFKKQ